MVQLNFNLEKASERVDFTKGYLEENRHYSNSDLETIANYILYGKDENGTSIVDRKEVEIKTKYGSYSKKEPESLDELMESPTFDERVFVTEKNRYKTIKPKIDRDKDSDIPDIGELWEVIDYYQHLIDVNKGKIEDPDARKLSSMELYKLSHMVIDLRRQQFYMRDSVKPTICMFGTSAKKNPIKNETAIPWDLEESDFSIAPLGVLINGNQRFYNPKECGDSVDYSYNKDAKYLIDFRNSEHIYYLLENYEDLRISSIDKPESTIGFLLDTLDFYISIAKLNEVKTIILDYKKAKVPNETIRQKLTNDLGVTHSANYISTIWKQRICGDIAAAASLHYDYYLNRNKPFAWKKCNQCGEFKLKDTREFMRKSRSSDGLANRCKECDKENRQKDKAKKLEINK